MPMRYPYGYTTGGEDFGCGGELVRAYVAPYVAYSWVVDETTQDWQPRTHKVIKWQQGIYFFSTWHGGLYSGDWDIFLLPNSFTALEDEDPAKVVSRALDLVKDGKAVHIRACPRCLSFLSTTPQAVSRV